MNPADAKQNWMSTERQNICALWGEVEACIKRDWKPGETVVMVWHDKLHSTVMNDLIECAHGWGWRAKWCHFTPMSGLRTSRTQIEVRAPVDCRWWEFWWWGK